MNAYTSDDYRQANRLVAELATGRAPENIRQALALADRMIEHVRSQVEDFADFVRRVENSEEFSLTESRQVAKTEKELKVIYLRAISLRETAQEAEARARRTAR